nr:1,4-dihydroxy-2-naphthoate octaprenyltransferase [Ignavibacteriaceae bacterium]
MNKTLIWILAARPKTLLAAFVPVIVGTSLAVAEGSYNLFVSSVALICSILIQIGTNFTNDLYDHLKGADTKERVGPKRALNEGWVTVAQMKVAIYLSFLLSFLMGLYLVYYAGPFILLIGILSIISGFMYTAGPFPLAYNGLGDLFVFLFFGFVGTVGTYFINTGYISSQA